jgi:hypothetical protein
MYGQSTKKRKQPHFERQFEVYNISSGTVVTFENDGAAADTGEPNQARRHALTKLKALDEHGDPLFVPVRPLPQHVQDTDRVCVDKVAVFRRLEDPCNDPNFATLKDKWAANADLRADFPQRFKGENREIAPAIVEHNAAKSDKLEAEKANKAAAGAVKRRPGRPAKVEPAPAEGAA